jgi:phosphoglycerate dehydrogenase-like enzyme
MSDFRVVLVDGAGGGEPFVRAGVEGAVVSRAESGSEALRAAIVDADAIVCADLSAEELALARRLRLVHVLGAGWDGIAVAALPRGCALCNVYEHEVAMAEWTLMGMLALARSLITYDRDLRTGVWGTPNRFEGEPDRDLRGRVVGIVGYGRIGREVARLAGALGMETLAVTRSPERAGPAADSLRWIGDMDSLSRLLNESDFVVLALPLDDSTRGLIAAAELQLLGPDGYLVNLARGPLVEEEALYLALRDRQIAGAALDVWYRYPAAADEIVRPASFPFWELDNVVMTPHSAGFTRSTFERRWHFIVDQLRRLECGGTLQNIVRAHT